MIFIFPGSESDLIKKAELGDNLAHLEEAAVLSYLVSCPAQTGASRPDSATGMAEYHFLGSSGVSGFQEQGSGGSFQASGAGTGQSANKQICATHITLGQI